MPSAYEPRRRSVDQREQDDSEEGETRGKAQERKNVEVAGPLTFWIGFLVFAVILQVVVVPVANGLGVGGSADRYITQIAQFIIYIPGCIILPLIAALLIGERVGESKEKSGVVLYSGMINALYSILVYVVAIFIIYLAVKYSGSAFLSSVNLTDFIEFLIVIPVVITVALVPLFALMSWARRRG